MQRQNTTPESSENPQQVRTSAAWPGTVTETRIEKLLPIAKVMEYTGFGSSYIYELIKQDRFPRPIKVGTASRWRESEVQSWIARLIQENVSNSKSGGSNDS